MIVARRDPRSSFYVVPTLLWQRDSRRLQDWLGSRSKMLSGFADAIGVSGKLGIIVAKNPKGEIVIERLVPGGPAAKDASLKAGDVLLQIDGKAVASDTDAVADQLLGAQGSEAVIKAKQNGLLGSSIKEVKLKRSQASDPNQGSPADPKRSSTSSSKAKEPASPSSLFGFISPQGSAQEVSPGQKPKKEADGGWNLFGDVGAALGLQTAGIFLHAHSGMPSFLTP